MTRSQLAVRIATGVALIAAALVLNQYVTGPLHKLLAFATGLILLTLIVRTISTYREQQRTERDQPESQVDRRRTE